VQANEGTPRAASASSRSYEARSLVAERKQGDELHADVDQLLRAAQQLGLDAALVQVGISTRMVLRLRESRSAFGPSAV
jgi:hypothetical protein